MSERVTRRLRIEGRVQGVWFRESMRREAVALGLTGWVRNRLDGSVEATIEGSAQAVQAMTEWARRGPGRADVQRVQELEAPAGSFATFETLPTA